MGEHKLKGKVVPMIGSKQARVYEHTEDGKLTLQIRWVRFDSEGQPWQADPGPIAIEGKTGDDLLDLLNECAKALVQPSLLPSDFPPVVKVLS
jgi:hypothetical protein